MRLLTQTSNLTEDQTCLTVDCAVRFPPSAHHSKGPPSSQLPQSESNYLRRSHPKLSLSIASMQCCVCERRVWQPGVQRVNARGNQTLVHNNTKISSSKWDKIEHVTGFYSNWVKRLLLFTGTCCRSGLITWNWSDSASDEQALPSGECQSTAAALLPSHDKWVVLSIATHVDPNGRLRPSD